MMKFIRHTGRTEYTVTVLCLSLSSYVDKISDDYQQNLCLSFAGQWHTVSSLSS